VPCHFNIYVTIVCFASAPQSFIERSNVSSPRPFVTVMVMECRWCATLCVLCVCYALRCPVSPYVIPYRTTASHSLGFPGTGHCKDPDNEESGEGCSESAGGIHAGNEKCETFRCWKVSRGNQNLEEGDCNPNLSVRAGHTNPTGMGSKWEGKSTWAALCRTPRVNSPYAACFVESLLGSHMLL
jgi:hypothetical protein